MHYTCGMKYIAVTEPGDADVLQLKERPTPQPGVGEVLIRVAASGVNRADVVQRMGLYPSPSGAPDWPGLEVAGEIAALGEGVEAWGVGDAVCALLPGGGYADHAVAVASECLPVPRGITMAEAAALPETTLTVWSNVVDRARLQPGERFLVHGGSSGIGTMAIQMMKQYGATVYTTAGSDEKVSVCRDLGAERAINYRTEDFVEVLHGETGGQGVDVILDMVGGDYVQRNMTIAAVEGRIVNIAYQQGFEATVNFAPLMLKRLSLMGSTLRAREAAFKARLTQSVRDRVWPWVEQGLVKPLVHRQFPAGEAAQAHRLMESSQHIGQLVLTW